MSVTVERLYRVTIGGKFWILSGEEATQLASGLVAALGTLDPPHALPMPVSRVSRGQSDAIAMDGEKESFLARETQGRTDSHASMSPAGPAASRIARFSGTRWEDAETDRLRALAAEGMTGPQIAAAMGRPLGTIHAKAAKNGLHLGGGPRGQRAAVPSAESAPDTPAQEAEPAEPAADAPAPRAAVTPEADPLAEQVRTGPLREWNLSDTRRLIQIMAGANTRREIEECAEEAARELSRTPMSCRNRWGHLKGAGRMTIERYLSDPESREGVAAG